MEARISYERALGLARALASAFGAKGIRVNALLPGGTDTAMGRIFANMKLARIDESEL